MRLKIVGTSECDKAWCPTSDIPIRCLARTNIHILKSEKTPDSRKAWSGWDHELRSRVFKL